MLLTATAAAIATLVPAFLSCAALVGGCWPDVLGGVTPPSGSLPAAGAFPPASAAGASFDFEAFAAAPATVNVHSPPATLARAVTAPTTSIFAAQRSTSSVRSPPRQRRRRAVDVHRRRRGSERIEVEGRAGANAGGNAPAAGSDRSVASRRRAHRPAASDPRGAGQEGRNERRDRRGRRRQQHHRRDPGLARRLHRDRATRSTSRPTTGTRSSPRPAASPSPRPTPAAMRRPWPAPSATTGSTPRRRIRPRRRPHAAQRPVRGLRRRDGDTAVLVDGRQRR